MPVERMTVGSYEQWGKLVKTWATGKDYVKNGQKYPKPSSIAELKQQCAWVGVDANIPAHYNKIEYPACRLGGDPRNTGFGVCSSAVLSDRFSERGRGRSRQAQAARRAHRRLLDEQLHVNAHLTTRDA